MKKYFMLISLVLLFSFILTGCGTASVKNGDTVKVHYSIKLESGIIFDTSLGGEPLKFTLGQGEDLPAFENAIVGMRVGESKTITIPADQAYGPHREDMIFEVERDELPADIDPRVGMQLQMNQGDGGIMIVTITEVSETTITIDANHPLAGHDLTFEIELVEITSSLTKPSSEESELSSAPLEEALTNGLPTIAEFGSSTCIPCKQMKPILEELAVEYKGKLNVVIVEVYEHIELTRQYGIMAIPTQIVFDSNGNEATRHMGFWAKEDIITQLKRMGVE